MAVDSRAGYLQIEKRIREWGQAQPEVRAIVVVGSQARRDRPADQYSDLDLILYADEPQALTAQPDWLKAFGVIWLAALDYTGAGEVEWLVLYQGGLKADFVLAQAEGKSLVEMLRRSPHQGVLSRGVRVLVDKTTDAGLSALPPPASGALPLPDAAAFRTLADRFCIQAARAVKLVRRGDLWRAKFAVDCEMKETLLRMLEWHARLVHNPQGDTWYGGRYLDEWADPRALEDLTASFAAYEPADLQRAWQATVELFWWLAGETAQRLEVDFPTPTDTTVYNWMGSL